MKPTITVETINAVGHILCHDVTQIITGEKKDVLFKKGHIIKQEDIPLLLSIGKENLYIWESKEGFLHENDAAEILYALCKSDFMHPSEIKEGKIDIISEASGLLKVDVERLERVNFCEDMMIATRKNNSVIKVGDKLAGTRVIPLLIESEKMEKAKEAAGDQPILSILPFKQKKVGIVTTGNEVLAGRIKDSFGPILIDKLSEYDTIVLGQKLVGDSHKDITKEIMSFIEQGADLVVCTGGMSVDADDNTPLAIKNTGAKIISYGMPVLPGAMFLLSYFENKIPIVGLPGCVMYGKRTIFDLLLPRLMADDFISKTELVKLGHGGLCLGCAVCHFPNCSFGN